MNNMSLNKFTITSPPHPDIAPCSNVPILVVQLANVSFLFRFIVINLIDFIYEQCCLCNDCDNLADEGNALGFKTFSKLKQP